MEDFVVKEWRKPEVRKKLFISQNGKCFYCHIDCILADKNKYYSSEDSLKWFVIDHKTPKKLGGSDLLSNMVGACSKCNQKKRVMSFSDFVKVCSN